MSIQELFAGFVVRLRQWWSAVPLERQVMQEHAEGQREVDSPLVPPFPPF